MASPKGSVTFFVVPYSAATLIAVGNLVMPVIGTDGWVVATAAARAAGGRSAGVAMSVTNGSGFGTVEIWMGGHIDPIITGIAAGAPDRWVRASSTGGFEVFTPVNAGTSDIVGKADANGAVTLDLGVWTETMAVGGGASTPTGTGIPHIVAGVQQAAATLIVDADVSASAAIAASKLAAPGSSGQLTMNASGAFAGVTNVASDGVNSIQFQSANGFIGLGWTTGGATIGFLRLKSGQSSSVLTIDDGIGGNRPPLIFLNNGGGPSLEIGTAAFNTNFFGSTITVSATVQATISAPAVAIGGPVGGNGTAWGSVNGIGPQAMADANQTPAAAVYQCTGIKTTGALTANRDLTLPTATDAQGYTKWINNTCTGAFSVNVRCTAGTQVLVANGKSASVWIDSRGVTRMTADI